jgi:pantetheine-phosphate adenylyltransferase
MNHGAVSKALFPGTFDPFTRGHLDLAERAAKMFPQVVIAVAESTGKATLFSIEERESMIREAIHDLPGDLSGRISVTSFGGLVVDCARDQGAGVMIRGLRAVSDFEFEFQMALMNRRLSSDVEIVFLMPDARYTYLNSSLVKEVARLGGDVKGLLPQGAWDRLMVKIGRKATA